MFTQKAQLRLDFALLFLYCALLYLLSNQATVKTPSLFENQDKFLHFTAYGIMAVLAWRSIRHLLQTRHILAFGSIFFCALFGFSDEWHQSFIPGRDSSAFDWLADFIGASFTVTLLFIYQNREGVKLGEEE